MYPCRIICLRPPLLVRTKLIEHVTIKNAGTGSTVAMWGGATCTIDEANISGSNGSQEGVITICDSNACTINLDIFLQVRHSQ